MRVPLKVKKLGSDSSDSSDRKLVIVEYVQSRVKCAL